MKLYRSFALLICGGLATVALASAQGPGAASAELRRVVLGGSSLRWGNVMPKLNQTSLPAYPPDAAGARGEVDLEIVVGTTGAVIHSRVVKSSDSSGALDRSALEAAQALQFEPAVEAGNRPVPVLVMLRLEFVPSDSAGKAAALSARVLALPRNPPQAGRTPVQPNIASTPTPGLQNPKAVRQVVPGYTERAMRAKTQGTVSLDVVILADGSVGAIRVAKSLDDDLDREAEIAALYWFFEPARMDGRPVASKVTLQLEFRLH